MSAMVIGDPTREAKDTAIPIFQYRAVRDREGMFSDTPYVEILIPGSRDTWVGPVDDDHKKRWPEAWRAFLEKKEAPLNGTPLAEWPAVGPADKAGLEANGVKTVEALANIPEVNLIGFGPNVLQLKHKAGAWLAAKGGWQDSQKQMAALEAENAELKARVATLETENAALKIKPPPKKRGRPPSEVTA